jgi:ribonuclease HI
MDDDRIVIYSDGGCKPNPGRGGWAVLLIWGRGGHDQQPDGADGGGART